MIDDNVISEVVFAVAPYVDTEEISDIRMRITMVLSKYEIKKAVTDIVPYQGDVNDEIRIADSVEELAEMCGKSVNCIRSDISHWKAGRQKTCRFRKVEIEEDNFAPAQKKEKGEVKDGKDHRNSKGNNGSLRREIRADRQRGDRIRH